MGEMQGPDLTQIINEDGVVLDPEAFGALFHLTPADALQPANIGIFKGNMGQVLRNRACPVSDAWRDALDEGGLDAAEQKVNDLARIVDRRSTFEFTASPEARRLEENILRRAGGENQGFFAGQ